MSRKLNVAQPITQSQLTTLDFIEIVFKSRQATSCNKKLCVGLIESSVFAVDFKGKIGKLQVTAVA